MTSEAATPTITPSKEFLDAVKNLMSRDEYDNIYWPVWSKKYDLDEQIKRLERKARRQNPLELFPKIDHDLTMRHLNAEKELWDIERKYEDGKKAVYELGQKQGLPYHFITKCINEKNARQTPCIKGCGKFLTVYSNFERDYVVCEACKLNEEKISYKQFQQEDKHRSEVNPLIRYCHDINNIAEPWEVPFELEQKRIEEKNNRVRDSIKKSKPAAGPLDKFSEYQFTSRSYKKEIPYDPSSGMSEAEWWKRVERKRLELKERHKQYKADNELRFNSATWQILRNLDVVDCRCKAELMRQGQFCPVCRLMIKVHEYALRLFKDAAQGRDGSSDMSISR
jgi:hypothetical protein